MFQFCTSSFLAALLSFGNFVQSATVRGRVTDSKTGEAMARVVVSIRDLKLETMTDENGMFEIPDVPPGEVELYISTVGYGLLRKKLQISAGSESQVEVLMGQEALRRSDQITVTTDVFQPVEPSAVSQHSLNNTELKNLAGVLVDDPLRSVQTLPGVATGDDFNAQFAVRGSGFRSIGLYIDGVLATFPFHAVRDVNDGGSLTILNGDLVESINLISGAAPARYSDRTGAVLNVETRDGSRDRIFSRANLAASGVSYTGEGPIGKSRKGSWLFSARKTYLDWLVKKFLDHPEEAIIFGYTDAQGRWIYDPNQKHTISITALVGDSEANRERELHDLAIESFLTGRHRSEIYNLGWRWIASPQTILQTRIYTTRDRALNLNRTGERLYETNGNQQALRMDLGYQTGERQQIETGLFLRRLGDSQQRRRFFSASGRFENTDRFAIETWQPGFYIQDTFKMFGARVSSTVGVRYDRLDLTKDAIWMPRASLAWSATKRLSLTAAYGQYSQFPDAAQLLGPQGSLNLRAERSTQYVVGAELRLTDNSRVRLELYDQEERNRIFAEQASYRLVNGSIASPSSGPILRNSLRGYSRGVEVLLQRRSANKLSGWISYAYGHARFRDSASGLAFDGDFDQRHTVSVYGSYRLTPTLNLSSKYRYGSNFPIVGFLQRVGGIEKSHYRVGTAFYLSDQKNQNRVPAYSRLDFRVNKAFHFDHLKLTLYGEITNVLARENVRYVDVDDVYATLPSFLDPETSTWFRQFYLGRASARRQTLLPFLPVAGVTFEF